MQITGVDMDSSDSHQSSLSSTLSSIKRRRATSEPCESDQAKRRKRFRGILQPFATLENGSIAEGMEEQFSGPSNSFPGKRKEKDMATMYGSQAPSCTVTSIRVIEDLTLELTCGCCTELCYNPVVVNPCQHFFCGGCCMLWIKNGGTNCPACRSPSTIVSPSRVLQSMLDLLLRFDPSKARTEIDKAEADKLYKVGSSFKLPLPRPRSPEPNIEPPNDNFARPCPTCLTGNPFEWCCPVPIRDPVADPEHAFDLDEGTPVGHAFCGNCDQLHNIQAPNTTKCDFCQASFCGMSVQDRCCALPLQEQQPHGFNESQDIIFSAAIYDKFHGNSVEVEILLDYLGNINMPLRRVYKDIISHCLQQPQGFTSFIESGIFEDQYDGPAGEDPEPNGPRRTICRHCAAQIFIHGLKDWWIRARALADLPEGVRARKDCPHGDDCSMQGDSVHSREFSHVLGDQGPPHEPIEQAPLFTSSLVPPIIPPLPATLLPQPFFQLPPLSRFDRFSFSDILPPLPMQPLIRRGIPEASHRTFEESPSSSPHHEDIPNLHHPLTSQDRTRTSESHNPSSDDNYFSASEMQNSDTCLNRSTSGSYPLPNTSTSDGQRIDEPMPIDADGIVMDPSYEGGIRRLGMSRVLLPML